VSSLGAKSVLAELKKCENSSLRRSGGGLDLETNINVAVNRSGSGTHQPSASMSAPTIVVLGSAVVDLVLNPAELPTPGRTAGLATTAPFAGA
jgi:hypothetical protein